MLSTKPTGVSADVAEAATPCALGTSERLVRGRALYERGRVREVHDLLDPWVTDDTVRACLGAPQVALAHGLLAVTYLGQGDLGAAADEGVALAAHLEDRGSVGASAHLVRGELASAFGETDTALDHFSAAGERVPAEDPLPWRAGAALTMLHTGRRQEAHALALAQLEVALHDPDPLGLPRALRTLATTEADDRRLHHLLEARDLLEGPDVSRMRAQVDVDLAGLHLVHGEQAKAVTLLRRVEKYAAARDLRPLLGRVRRLLAHLDQTPRALRAEALDALSAAERRATELALEGLTNRLIAEQLEISVKAVESNLSRSYRKLGVPSRAALLAAYQG